MRILKGNSFLLTSPTFVDTDNETPVNCSGNPTVAVLAGDGTTLAAPTVTQPSATNLGVYQAALTPTVHTLTVNYLTVTWTGTMTGGQTQVYTQQVEVVGAHYCTIPELRAMPALSDPNKFSTQLLMDMRDEFEDTVERICGVAFVRRYQYDTLDGKGTDLLRLNRLRPRTVLSVTVNGTAETVTDFDLLELGKICWRKDSFPFPDTVNGRRNCKIAYEHGYDAPPPQLKRQALQVIRADCLAQVAAGIPNNAISSTFDGTTIRFSTPDPSKDRYTGVIALDPILYQLRETYLGMAT